MNDVEKKKKRGQRALPFKEAPTFVRHGNNGITRYTAAVVMDIETDNVAIAVSVCDPRDQFSRRIGRAMAVGRAKLALTFKRNDSEKIVRSVLFVVNRADVGGLNLSDADTRDWFKNFVLPRLPQFQA